MLISITKFYVEKKLIEMVPANHDPANEVPTRW
jgi:hypothetical protein